MCYWLSNEVADQTFFVFLTETSERLPAQFREIARPFQNIAPPSKPFKGNQG
jgi:hypothetical protein